MGTVRGEGGRPPRAGKEAFSMRRSNPRRCGALVAWVAATALLGLGDAGARGEATPAKGEETVADLALLSSAGETRVEGVGLVVNLDNTGSDPEPSWYREHLLDEMRKARVEGAEKILASRRTSLVIVKGVIPAGVTPQDRLDVTLELSPASTTTSLAGGFLILTRLSEVAVAPDGRREGAPLASAYGPVLTGTAAQPDDLKVGRILGGCRVKKEVPFLVLLREKHQSARTAKLLQDVINQRFHQREGIDQKGMAVAKTDKLLELRVPPVYHQNQGRYFQVVKLLSVVDNPVLRARRQERWARELLDPRTAGVGALRLEGIGRNAVEPLKPGLASPDPQVRFFAAEALAYLDDSSGVDVLAAAAAGRPEFRAFALAALAALDQPAATLRLRQLVSEADVQVRYGAFNALRIKDESDPFLGRVPVLEEPEPDPDLDPLALRLAEQRRSRRGPQEDPFALYVVDCDGPPLVHVARTRRCEIVLFGRGQTLLTPLVLGGAGAILVNAADGDEVVQVSRIDPSRPDRPDLRRSCPLDLGAVIRQAANLEATYPEILAILQAAERQKNLPGPLVVDALPAPNPAYDEAQLRSVVGDAKTDDAVGRAGAAAAGASPAKPGLFQRLRRRIHR
jgi:Flagellar P-ring protein/HEAT repeats